MINSQDITNVFEAKLPRALEIATEVYNKSLNERVALIQAMQGMEFKFGQVVKIVSHIPMAHMLGSVAGYGVIVGHNQFEDDSSPDHLYYRVHYSNRNPFTGVNASSIQKIDSWDEVPEELKEYKMRIYITHRKYVFHTINTFI